MSKMITKEYYIIKVGEKYIYSRCYCVADEDLARKFACYSSAVRYAENYFAPDDYKVYKRTREIIT